MVTRKVVVTWTGGYVNMDRKPWSYVTKTPWVECLEQGDLLVTSRTVAILDTPHGNNNHLIDRELGFFDQN